MYRHTAILGGVIGGAVGAAIWAGIAFFTGYEIGWIAWGIGLLVGVGVAMGNKGEGSPAAGVLAAVIAALSVAGGKYATVQLLLPDESEIGAMALAGLEDEEVLISYVADDVVSEFEEAGKMVNWPADVDPYSAASQAEYPEDVWSVAQARWDGMASEQRTQYTNDIRLNIEASIDAFRDVMAQQGFMSTFGLMDLIFFGLAIFTAFKAAAGGGGREAEASA